MKKGERDDGTLSARGHSGQRPCGGSLLGRKGRTGDPLVPGLDDLAAPDLELERRPAVAGRVELSGASDETTGKPGGVRTTAGRQAELLTGRSVPAHLLPVGQRPGLSRTPESGDRAAIRIHVSKSQGSRQEPQVPPPPGPRTYVVGLDLGSRRGKVLAVASGDRLHLDPHL
jgi:hypothetical protein